METMYRKNQRPSCHNVDQLINVRWRLSILRMETSLH